MATTVALININGMVVVHYCMIAPIGTKVCLYRNVEIMVC